jgi:signal transduction histidine kinase
LPALLDLSVSGVVAYTPVLDTSGQVVDFAFAYLNPAAQRLLHLSAQPQSTFGQQFAEVYTNGSFAFHRDAFLAGGEVRYLEQHYQADGYDAYFRVAARALSGALLVSFSPSTEADRQVVELDLRASQAREQAARAEAETQRQRFYDVLQQLPAQVATYHGPDHRFTFVNSGFRAFVPTRELLGRPVREASEGAVGEEVFALLDRVYATGEVVRAQEVEVHLPASLGGESQPVFVNASYHPLRDADGHIYGVLDFSYDVTGQVLARRQVEQLNQELETRVAARTQQLTDQRQQLGQILAQVPAAIATLEGPEHRFAFANNIYRAIVGGRATVGQPAAEAQPELVAQGFIDLLNRVYTTGEPYLGHEIPVQLHGAATGAVEERYVDFSYQPLRDGQGRITGILTFAVDETEKVLARRQTETLQAAMLAVAQRRAQEREDLFQTFEQAPATIMLLRGSQHRIEYVNPAYQQFFPGQQLRGLSLAKVYPRAAARGALARLDWVYKTGEAYVGQEEPVSLALAPGQPAQTRYFNYTCQPYRENGQTVGVSIFATDATEQALARQQREAQVQELSRIFEQAPVAITIMRGPALVLELANASMRGIWGRSATQVLRQPYFTAVPDTGGQGFEERLGAVLTTGQPFAISEAPVRLDRAHTGLPELGYFNFIFHPLFDAQQQTTGLIAVGTEVTEQVLGRQQVQQLNHALQITNQQLTRTNADLDTFVYAASHDLKAPIANIEGLVAALREYLPADHPEPMVPRLLGMIDGAVRRFQQTVGHLTDISRLEHAAEQTPEAVDLAEVLRDVCLDLQPLLESTQAELQLAVAGCPPVRLLAKNLRSVVFNLLSNAVKYRDPARVPVVQVRAQPTATHVVLAVQDNGLGLSEHQQSQLFTMFRRLHTHVEGSGVGLYLLKRTVENAGGRIAVQSQPGVGSTFTVTLPRA